GAAPGGGGDVLIRDLATGKPQPLRPRRFGPPAEIPVHSIDVAPDGKTLALGGSAGVIVCDFDGKVLFEIANNPAGLLANANNDRPAIGSHFTYGICATQDR